MKNNLRPIITNSFGCFTTQINCLRDQDHFKINLGGTCQTIAMSESWVFFGTQIGDGPEHLTDYSELTNHTLTEGSL